MDMLTQLAMNAPVEVPEFFQCNDHYYALVKADIAALWAKLKESRDKEERKNITLQINQQELNAELQRFFSWRWNYAMRMYHMRSAMIKDHPEFAAAMAQIPDANSGIGELLKKEIEIMSKFLTDSLALVDKISVGSADDAATKQAVADLTAKLGSDEVNEADSQQVITAILNKLAAAPAGTTGAGTGTGSTGTGNLPVVSSISPANGAIAGGDVVTLTGTGFTGATAVSFNGVPATNVNVASDTSITATTPALTAGAQSVTVTTPAGQTAAGGVAFTAA